MRTIDANVTIINEIPILLRISPSPRRLKPNYSVIPSSDYSLIPAQRDNLAPISSFSMYSASAIFRISTRVNLVIEEN